MDPAAAPVPAAPSPIMASAPPTMPAPMIWRRGKTLIMSKVWTLDNRCIKCNGPADKRIKRTLYWHHPALFLTVFAGLIIYVILAIVLRKRAKVEFAVCLRHRQQHWIRVAIAWLVPLVGIGMVAIAISMESIPLLIAGFVVFLGGLVYAAVAVPYLKPKLIDDHFVWLKGCCPEYLSAFPEWLRS